MLKTVIAALFAAALAAPAFGQTQKAEEKKPLTESQQRMSDCSKQASAKGMKGDDREKFMSSCLKGGGDKMAACNTQADEKKLHGAARDSFVKKCAAPS